MNHTNPKKRTRKQYLRSLKNWSKAQPTYHERTLMQKKCGDNCFLGTRKSFPICRPNCTIDNGGVMSAYMRAKEMYSRTKKGATKKHKPYYYRNIASRAKRILYGK